MALETILRMKINEELREEKSLIYSSGLSCTFYATHWPAPLFETKLHFTCAPENRERVIAGLEKIFNDLKEKQLSQEKINAIKSIMKNRSGKNSSNNWWWSYVLRDLTVLKQDINDILKQEEYIEKLTSKTLQAHAIKYLDRKNMLIGVMNPQKRSKQEKDL